MVQGSRTESDRHFVPSSPPNTDLACAVLLLVTTSGHYRAHSLSVRKASTMGWTVLDLFTQLDGISVRRFSRYPKLAPAHFFPTTQVVLYSDLNVIESLHTSNPRCVARSLLANSSFGIIQHERSATIQDEKQAILTAYRTRPLVDDIDILERQVRRIEESSLPSTKTAFGILGGGIHAHRILGEHTSHSIDETWLDEYMRGCDRDQIAFFAMDSRLVMQSCSMGL